jgi:hypothetical protein
MPPRWKGAVVVWLAIYPCLTFLPWLAGPMIASWALPLRTSARAMVASTPSEQRRALRDAGSPAGNARPLKRSAPGVSREDQVQVAELVPEVAVLERRPVGTLEELAAGGGLEQGEV